MKFVNFALFSTIALSVNTLSVDSLFSNVKREIHQGVNYSKRELVVRYATDKCLSSCHATLRVIEKYNNNNDQCQSICKNSGKKLNKILKSLQNDNNKESSHEPQGVVTNGGKATISELSGYGNRFDSAKTVKVLLDLIKDCEYFYRAVIKNKEGRDKELEAEIDGIEDEVFKRIDSFAGDVGPKDDVGNVKDDKSSMVKRAISKILKL
ncbi:hypothetical protein K502DRAFT_20662 [Neoconidiobolus thromboides FSU 785]|nr:hypothetical protein K502DRAFT_20662 [Neoconidiobolus thromboides FSU 785]